MTRLPKLIEQAHLTTNEPHPDSPGYLLPVQLHYDRDRGWYEVTVQECAGERRKVQQRYQDAEEAREAVGRVYASYGPEAGMWEVKQYG